MLFRNCLRALQVAIEISPKGVQELVEEQQNPPLRIIIQKLVDSRSNEIEETILIIQFLNTYAQNKRGAQHLYAESIFQHLQ